MTLKLYAMKDKKTGFLTPQVDSNHASAKRNFQLMLATARGDSIMAFAPEDFELYYLGEFENTTGIITQPTIPEFLMDGSSLEV